MSFRDNGGFKWECVVESFSSTTKTIYLHYRNAYDHQTWQGGDLPW